MNAEQYNALPDDLKLDARLAITLGHYVRRVNQERLLAPLKTEHPQLETVTWEESYELPVKWQPRQDPAILWGLLGVNTTLYEHGKEWVCDMGNAGFVSAKSKADAVITAYCRDDRYGNWDKWCKDNGVAE